MGREECKAKCSLSIASLQRRLCPDAKVRDLIELGMEITQQYKLYEDKSQAYEMFPILDEEQDVTPELGK